MLGRLAACCVVGRLGLLLAYLLSLPAGAGRWFRRLGPGYAARRCCGRARGCGRLGTRCLKKLRRRLWLRRRWRVGPWWGGRAIGRAHPHQESGATREYRIWRGCGVGPKCMNWYVHCCRRRSGRCRNGYRIVDSAGGELHATIEGCQIANLCPYRGAGGLGNPACPAVGGSRRSRIEKIIDIGIGPVLRDFLVKNGACLLPVCPTLRKRRRVRGGWSPRRCTEIHFAGRAAGDSVESTVNA